MTTALRRLGIRSAAGLAVVAAGWWAFRPLERPDLSLPPPPEEAPRSDGPGMQVALDDSAFHAPLWLAPPPPPPPPPPEPAKAAPPPPLKLQLLAIVRVPESGQDAAAYRAMLYDPDADKILEVAAGDRIGERTVVGVTQNDITLREQAGTRTLSLRAESSATGAGGGTGTGTGGES